MTAEIFELEKELAETREQKRRALELVDQLGMREIRISEKLLRMKIEQTEKP